MDQVTRNGKYSKIVAVQCKDFNLLNFNLKLNLGWNFLTNIFENIFGFGKYKNSRNIIND